MTSKSATSLLQGAADDGLLGAGSMMAFQVPNLGAQIQAGLGISVDDVEASEVFLLALLVDDSSSINQGSNAQAVRDGVNLVYESVEDSKTSGDVLVSCRFLNGTVLDAYTPLDTATKLDAKNFRPYGGTPLYDESVVTLGTVLAKAQEFEDAGVPVRTVSVIITDGADYGSRSQTPDSVASVVGDMLRAESHLVFFIGIKDGYTDFAAVAASMGIAPEYVLTPGNSPTEIRAAMRVVSRSVVRASQGGTGFSQAAASGLGGFGT